MRIVIAEDERRACRGLKALLASISPEAEVTGEAYDGRQAFEMIRQQRPDVVFTDIRMPYMDGISLIRAVRDHRIPVKFVIISAYEEFEYARQAIALGVVDYLVKPVTREEVYKVWCRLKEDAVSGDEPEPESDSLKALYPDAHPLILRALDIIQSSYATKISQKELSEMLGISAEYFCFLFKRDTKENFSRFLRRYRIEKAKQLLDEGEVPRDEIPYSVGFSDPKYFYKCFKEETGINMTEYTRTKLCNSSAMQ